MNITISIIIITFDVDIVAFVGASSRNNEARSDAPPVIIWFLNRQTHCT